MSAKHESELPLHPVQLLIESSHDYMVARLINTMAKGSVVLGTINGPFAVDYPDIYNEWLRAMQKLHIAIVKQYYGDHLVPGNHYIVTSQNGEVIHDSRDFENRSRNIDPSIN